MQAALVTLVAVPEADENAYVRKKKLPDYQQTQNLALTAAWLSLDATYTSFETVVSGALLCTDRLCHTV